MARILVVDDDEQIAKFAQAVLVRSGHEVKTATRPERAMQLCRIEAFDLVLSDINMPGNLDGHDLARWVAGSFPKCRVALMSTSAEDCKMCPFLAGCPLLRKPFNGNRMVAFISSALKSQPKIDWDKTSGL